MVRALVIGDPHFKTSNVEDIEAITTQSVYYAEKYQPDFIVCLGDLLDRHEMTHFYPLTKASNFLKQLKSVAKTYLLIGNHDRPNNSVFLTGEHCFDSIKGEWTNTVVVDTVHEEVIQGKRFIFVPYVPPGRFHEALPENYKSSSCIFAHQEFRGAKMGAMISTEGDEWTLEDPLVISGHVHDQQVLDQVFYTGSPVPHGFAESSIKGIYLFDFLEEITHTFLPIEVKRKIITTIHASQIDSFTPDPTVTMKLIVEGTPAEIAAVIKSKTYRKLQKTKGLSVKTKALRTRIDREGREIGKLIFEDVLLDEINNNEGVEAEFMRTLMSRILA